jgi:hypothetical protein
MRRYRRNADAQLRSAERAFQESGDVESHVRYLGELLRANLITPERVAMAAYLGNRAARAMDFSPPPGPTETLWVYTSRAHEVLDRAPITTKHATLFACDVATRALMRVADPEHPDAGVFLWAFRVINTARSWVLGGGGEDPGKAADELWANPVARRLRNAGVPEFYALECAMNAGYAARRQPKEHARNVISGSMRAAEQYAAPGSVHGDPGREEATFAEIAWQDNHLALALLSPSWPVVQGL